MVALGRSDDEKLQKRAFRLSGCCSWPVAIVKDDGDVGLSLGRCRDRMCGLCCNRRSMEAADRLTPIVQAMPAARFMTLTLRSFTGPLGPQLDRLFEHFRTLRRRAEWARYVRGGVATIEITYNRERQTWHPHLHIIFDGGFYPQKLLADAWHAITGDSYIVDVRAVHDRAKGVSYVAKYVGKPANFEGWPPAAICEYATAMHGRRTILTFGQAHNVRVDPRDTGDRPKASRILQGLVHLVRQANAGDPDATTLVRALPFLGREWATFVGVQPPAEFVDDPERRKSAAIVLETALDRATQWARNGSKKYEQPPDRFPERPPLRTLFSGRDDQEPPGPTRWKL